MRQPTRMDLLGLVVSLLRGQGERTGQLQCAVLPAEGDYAVRLDAPENPGTAVLLPGRPLERALTEPQVRVWVSHVLRSAIEALGSRRMGPAAHLAAYFTSLDVRSLPGPRCLSCEGPILVEAPVVVRGGSRWHLICPPAW